MVKRVRRSNVKDGVLLPLGNGFSLVKGDNPNKVDDVDIGPNNKNGLSVNHGEILQQQGNTLRVFSAEPMLGGVSPVQLLYGGMTPDKVFAMQERYKYIHGINDDGSKKKAEDGGEYIVQKGDTLWGIAKKNNISYQQLKSYNTDISNPNLIRIGQKIKLSGANNKELPKQDIDIKEYYEKENKLNSDNITAIQGAKHSQNYAIIDKNNKTIKVYDANNNLLYESNKINTGAANTDYNTVTYSNRHTGKLMYSEGNNSTPAGITVVSSKGMYHGSPSFQRARVNGDGSMKTVKDANGNEIPDNIASSIHWEKGIDGPNRSNGCVRADTATLAELNKYLDVGSKIYTLPQQHGSAFQLRDGVLNFVDTRTQDERNADEEYRKGTKKLSDGREVSLKYHRDINTVYNGIYRPITIEDTKKIQDRNPNKIKSFVEGLYYDVDFSSPNHYGNTNNSFQNVKSSNRKQYAESLANNKEAIMKAIPALSNKEYNILLQMALGLPERESHYNTDIKHTVENTFSDKLLSFAKMLTRGKDSVRSIGYGKVKSKTDNDELKEIYKKLNIKYDDKWMNGEDSAKMVMAKLAYTYLSEVKGRHFVDSKGQSLNDMQALYYAYTGNKKNKIKDNLYRYDKEWVKDNYEEVMNYGNDFKVKQKFQFGGRKRFQIGGEDDILMRTDPEGNLIDSIQPSVVTAKLPTKFNGSQNAAARYAEGYKFGKMIAKKRDEAVRPIVNAILPTDVNKDFDDNAISFAPGIGDVLQGAQGVRDIYNGNYGKGITNLGLLLAPNFIEKPIKASFKYVPRIAQKYLNNKNLFDGIYSATNSIVTKPILYKHLDNKETLGERPNAKYGKEMSNPVKKANKYFERKLKEENPKMSFPERLQRDYEQLMSPPSLRNLKRRPYKKYKLDESKIQIDSTKNNSENKRNKALYGLDSDGDNILLNPSSITASGRPFGPVDLPFTPPTIGPRNPFNVKAIKAPTLANSVTDKYGVTTGVDGNVTSVKTPETPGLKVPVVTPKTSKSSGLPAWGADLIGAGINAAGSLIAAGINQNAIDNQKFTPRQYNLLNPVKLKTKINIEPQLTKLKEMQAQIADAARRTSGSSREAYRRILAGHNRVLQSAMDLYGSQENMQTELINKDRLNQQSIAAQNSNRVMETVNYNITGKDALANRKAMLTAQNWINPVNVIAGTVAGPQGLLARRDARRNTAANLAMMSLAHPDAARMIMSGDSWQKAFNGYYDMLNNKVRV